MTVILDKADSPLADTVVVNAVHGYLKCALWLGYHYETENHLAAGDGTSLDDVFSLDDIEETPLEAEAREDVEDFVRENWADVSQYLDRFPGEYVGHDFLLTRNGHGAGFWDRGLGDLGDRLAAAARAYSGHNLTSYGVDSEGEPNVPVWEG